MDVRDCSECAVHRCCRSFRNGDLDECAKQRFAAGKQPYLAWAKATACIASSRFTPSVMLRDESVAPEIFGMS